MISAKGKIPHDNNHELLVVVPTIGNPENFKRFYRRLISHSPEKTKIVISINPINENEAEEIIDIISSISRDGIKCLVERCNEPIGFSAAVNRGLMKGIESGGIPKYIGIFNDDISLSSKSISGLIDSLEGDTYCLPAEVPDLDTLARTRYPRSGIPKVGMVGPVSDFASGIQTVIQQDQIESSSYDEFADYWLSSEINKDIFIMSKFISGFCTMMTRSFVKDLMLDDGQQKIGIYDEVNFPIGGFEDNDLCVRAYNQGWTTGVSWGTFVGHLGSLTLKRIAPLQQQGFSNQYLYYNKWKNHTYKKPNHKISSVYRVKLVTVNDVLMFRESLIRHSSIVDFHAVLMTNNPLDIIDSYDWPSMNHALTASEKKLLQDCSGKGPRGVVKAVKDWIKEITRVGLNPEVNVDVWEKGFNERDERNRAIELAESMKPDWCISIDHDEILEDRITRGHFERYMRHPDPLVDCWEFGWLNHWDSPRICRIDAPWGDAGKFIGGMRGFRLWRVRPKGKLKIVSGTPEGLHCGNVPPFSPSGGRHSGARFRHFGYLHSEERMRKHAFYLKMDKNPDIRLVGNSGYNHLINEEKMMMRPYHSKNGIGLHMLVYEKENPIDISQKLNDLNGMMDQVVLVWTGNWNDEDKFWNTLKLDPFDVEEWPKTGPSQHLAFYAHVFNAAIIHHPLEGSLADCRNAGIKHLGNFQSQGLGWTLFLDPDEFFVDAGATLPCLREMALTTTSWGWLFKFKNLLPGGGASTSESIRMVRLDNDMTLKMTGRVHESFKDSMDVLKSMGIHPQVQYAPFEMANRGLNGTPEQNRAKVIRYHKMLLEDLEENPLQPGPWVSLGLQYNNDGNPEIAKECFERAVICAGDSYLPFMELALYHLRVGRALLKEVVSRTASHHSARDVAEKGESILAKLAPGQPYLDTGGPVTPDSELPYFPFEDLISNVEKIEVDSINSTDSFSIEEGQNFIV